MDKVVIENAVSSVRGEDEKIIHGAKTLVSDENTQKVRDFAKSIGTQEGREKATESARQDAKASRMWFLAFWNDVKTHFKSNDNLTVFAAWRSRFINLWTCGLNGKIAIVVPVIILGSTPKLVEIRLSLPSELASAA